MKRLALLTSLVALAFTLPIQAREKAELRFQGKTLKDWVTRLQTADTDEQRHHAAKAAREAIRKIEEPETKPML